MICVFQEDWEGIMVWGSGFRLFSVRGLLLVAFAIQGITPDPQDVVSLRGLYVLCGVPLPLEDFGNDFSEQEVAVCSPFGQQLKMDLGTLIDRSLRSRIGSLSPRLSLGHARAFLPDAIELRAIQNGQLCISLCRLAC
jgi:hypothetical protein